MTSILIMIIATIIILGFFVFFMSIGLILQKKPLQHNGCGSHIDESGQFVPCDSCSTLKVNDDLHKALVDEDFMKTFGKFARGRKS